MNYLRTLPLAFCATLALGADFPATLTPVLLHTADDPALVPAVRIASKMEASKELGQASREAKYGYSFTSTLSTKPDTNTETTNLDLYAGLRWKLEPVRRNTSAEPEPNLNDPNAKEAPQPRALHPGYLFAHVSAAYESDQKFENTQSALGLRLNYEPDGEGPEYKWILPSAWVDYNYIHQFGSTLAAKLGLSEQNYWRLGTGVSWDIPLTPGFKATRPDWKFTLTPSLGYYRNTDLVAAMKDAGLSEARNASLTARYEFLGHTGLQKYLKYIAVGIARGHVPPKTVDATTYSLSVGIAWGGK